MGLERYHSEVLDSDNSTRPSWVIPAIIILVLIACSIICGIIVWLSPEWLVNLCHNL